MTQEDKDIIIEKIDSIYDKVVSKVVGTIWKVEITLYLN